MNKEKVFGSWSNDVNLSIIYLSDKRLNHNGRAGSNDFISLPNMEVLFTLKIVMSSDYFI